MKISFDRLAETLHGFNFDKAKKNTKEFVSKYYKLAGTVLVAGAMVAVCSVNLADRMNEKHASVGIMMTVADVSADKEPFSGDTFEVAGISYDDMVNVSYETNELAQIEKSEKSVEEILSAKQQSRRDKVVLEALTAQHIEPEAPDMPEETVPVTAPTTSPTYADENGTYEYVGEFVLTAYCPCPICCGAYSNMTNPTTASGTTATAGRTIAASSAYAFGTQFVINGQIYTVEDRGSAINGNRIDIFFDSHDAALAFGRQTASVYRVVQ